MFLGHSIIHNMAWVSLQLGNLGLEEMVAGPRSHTRVIYLTLVLFSSSGLILLQRACSYHLASPEVIYEEAGPVEVEVRSQKQDSQNV